MALTFGVRDVRKIAAVLEGEYASAEEAAEAVLKASVELYESKAKFLVVAQVKEASLPPGGSHELGTVVLGPFGTKKQAETAGQSVAIESGAKHREARWLIADAWTGSPAAWWKSKKDNADENKKDSPADRLLKEMSERGELPGSVIEKGE